MKGISLFPMGAFPLLISTHSAVKPQVRQIRNGVRTFSSLLSLFFSPIITVITFSRSAGCGLVRFWRSSMLCLMCHHCVSLVYPHRASCFRPKPPTWNIPTNNEHHRSLPALSYLHHVVLGIHEVDHLVHTITEDPGTRVSLGTMPYLATPLTTAPNCQIASRVPGLCVLRSTIAFCHVHSYSSSLCCGLVLIFSCILHGRFYSLH